MSQIAGELREIRAIDKEVIRIKKETKRLNAEIRKLNKRREMLCDKVIDYLDAKNQPGVRFGELVVLKNEKTVAGKRKKKREKERDVCDFLKRYVARDDREAKKLYSELMDVMSSDKEIVEYLDIQNVGY